MSRLLGAGAERFQLIKLVLILQLPTFMPLTVEVRSGQYGGEWSNWSQRKFNKSCQLRFPFELTANIS